MIEIYENSGDDEPQTIIAFEGMQYDSFLLELINEKEFIVSLTGLGYSLHEIVYDNYIKGIEYSMIYDRNLCSYINDLVNGNRLNNPLLRNVIALLTYVQIGKIISEPTIAYYEYAQSSDFKKLKMDLMNFSKADNHDFRQYLNYLNGGMSIERLCANIKKTKENDFADFTEERARKKLTIFKHNVITVKKAILLMLQGFEHKEVFIRLLEWMYGDYLFTGVAFPWLIQNITPLNRGKILRDICFRNINNWTWDMSLIQYCLQRNIEFKKTKHFCFLASNDKALKRAYKFIARSDVCDSVNELKKLILESWGDEKASEEISLKYEEVILKQNDPNRMRFKGLSEDYINELENMIDIEITNII